MGWLISGVRLNDSASVSSRNTITNALYYPYIHIRDVNWLKGTLPLFPRVRRMIPILGAMHNSKEIQQFTQPPDNKRALLFVPADLFGPCPYSTGAFSN